MSRITGSDAKALMEAYAAVYAPQEITEEQTWQEVENWVNSLVEEGYDLSEYTWEDMYEAYIEEQGRNKTPQAVIDRNRAALGNTLGRLGNRIMTGNPEGTRTPIRQTPNRRGGGTNKPPAAAKPQIGNLPASARQVTQYPAGVSTGVGGGNAGASPAPKPKPAPAPAPKPAARPAAPASTAKTAPTPAAKPATPLQTAASNLSGKGALAPAPKKPSLASQAAELRAMRQRSQERQGLTQSFDAFDAIKGHLLDEGYADTEEAAVAIMANMSEEWKQTILEADSVAKMAERAAKRRQQRYGKQGGGGRDDFRPYTKDDYENPKPGYGSGPSSQAKGA